MKGLCFAAGALTILVVLVFGKTTGYEYVMWDDRGNVYENPQIPLEAPLSEVGSFWEKPYLGFYIPVVYTVWAGIASVSEQVHYPETGMELVFSAKLFHLVNVALHLGSSLMVLLILHRLLGRRDVAAAALGAAVFAVHPLQVEAVAWVTGLKDVLSALLALAATLVFLRQAELTREGKGGAAVTVRFWASVGLFAAALLCKTHLIALPVALIWFEYVLAKTPMRSLGWKLAPFAAVGIVFTAATFWGQYEPIPVIGSPVEEKIVLWKRGIVALDAVTFYVSKVLYPFGLAPDYGRNPKVALGLFGTYPLWAAGVIALGWLTWKLRKHEGRVFFFTGLGVAALTLAPVLGLIQFGFQGYSTVADRYMYFSMAGVGLCVAAGLTFAGKGARRKRLLIGAGVMVAVLAVAASRQVGHWRSCSTLFTHCLTVNPKSVAAYSNLAAAAAHSGRFEESIRYGEKIVAMVPRWSAAEAMYSEALARDYMMVGRFEEALPLLKRAVELAPGSEKYGRSLEEWGEMQ